MSDQYLSAGQLARERLLDVGRGAAQLIQERPVIVAGSAAALAGFAVVFAIVRRPKRKARKAAEAMADDVVERVGAAKKAAIKKGRAYGKAADYAEIVRLGRAAREPGGFRGLIVGTVTKRLAKRFS